MVPKPPDVRVFEALANGYRRQLLLALQDANPQRDDDLDPLDLLVDGQSEADLAVSEVELIVIIVGLFRIDRTQSCGRTGKSLQ
ncbi:hypothetical protein BRC64_04530 [Halobacteriales archaeon QH_10_67_22]|nr:MAG: hypothetical protein BRC64_04530 [Halobacteriales archaeon QH_10_67_22]